MSDATEMYAKAHASVDLSDRLRQCAAQWEWEIDISISGLLRDAADALDATYARVMQETERRWRAEFYAELIGSLSYDSGGFQRALKRIEELKRKAGE